MCTDVETMKPCIESVSPNLQAAIEANCKDSSESDKHLVSDPDSEGNEAVVSDSEVREADELSEVGLVGEIEVELDELSENDYDELDEVSEAREADK